MHPPAGGSRASQGYVALPFDFARFLLVLPRRFIRATATGVMPPTHNPPLRYSAAFPILLLLLLFLSRTSPTSSSLVSCLKGKTYWDTNRQSCVNCTPCPSEAPFVLVPCGPTRDARCANFSSLRIELPFLKGPAKQQKRFPEKYQRPWSTQSVQKATSAPQRYGISQKVRPKTPEGRGLVPESAARVMETREPTVVPEERVVLPSVHEEEATWTWHHWLVAGFTFLVVCGAVLFFASLTLRRTRGWERCASSINKSRTPVSRKGRFSKSEKTDHGAARGECIDRFSSDKQHTLIMEVILSDKKRAAEIGSHRDESANLYVKEMPVKVSPASSTVVTMMPGTSSSVKVEVQGDSIHRNLTKHCLRLGCASRTELTGRSSAV